MTSPLVEDASSKGLIQGSASGSYRPIGLYVNESIVKSSVDLEISSEKDDLVDSISSRIEDRLHVLGWTSYRLAKEAGFEPGYVAKIIRKRSENIRPESLRKLAQVLGVSYEWLATGTGGIEYAKPGHYVDSARETVLAAAEAAGVAGPLLRRLNELPVPDEHDRTTAYWAKKLEELIELADRFKKPRRFSDPPDAAPSEFRNLRLEPDTKIGHPVNFAVNEGKSTPVVDIPVRKKRPIDGLSPELRAAFEAMGPGGGEHPVLRPEELRTQEAKTKKKGA